MRKFKKPILLILFKFIKTYLYSMAENPSSLLPEAQAYVTDLLQGKLSKTIKFHTLEHTREVVAASEKLADHYQLPEDDRLPLIFGRLVP